MIQVCRFLGNLVFARICVKLYFKSIFHLHLTALSTCQYEIHDDSGTTFFVFALKTKKYKLPLTIMFNPILIIKQAVYEMKVYLIMIFSLFQSFKVIFHIDSWKLFYVELSSNDLETDFR